MPPRFRWRLGYQDSRQICRRRDPGYDFCWRGIRYSPNEGLGFPTWLITRGHDRT